MAKARTGVEYPSAGAGAGVRVVVHGGRFTRDVSRRLLAMAKRRGVTVSKLLAEYTELGLTADEARRGVP